MYRTIRVTEISGVGEEHHASVLLLVDQISKISEPTERYRDQYGIGALIHLKDGSTIHVGQDMGQLNALLEAEPEPADGPFFRRALDSLEGIERNLHRIAEEIETHLMRKGAGE